MWKGGKNTEMNHLSKYNPYQTSKVHHVSTNYTFELFWEQTIDNSTAPIDFLYAQFEYTNLNLLSIFEFPHAH